MYTELEYGYKDGSLLTANFGSPKSLAIDRHNNLYVADQFLYYDNFGNEHDLHSVRVISAIAGNVTTMAGRVGKAQCVYSLYNLK